MASTNLVSYELNGVKESFANWISNISPTDTPFVSMTGKEAITNKYFQWQRDWLAPAALNFHAEGSDAGTADMQATTVEKNVTQILRKVISVSDTADALSNYGRGNELAYQMEKAGAEIKRDLEYVFLRNVESKDGTTTSSTGAASGTAGTVPGLNNGIPGIVYNAAGVATSVGLAGAQTGTGALPGTAIPVANGGNATTPVYATGVRQTAGIVGLISAAASPEGNVKVVAKAAGITGGSTAQTELDEASLFQLTANLYTTGAKPSVILFHPKHAAFFSSLMEGTGATYNRQRMFDGAEDTKINTYVSMLVDPLGQEFKLMPDRFMPEDRIYIIDPADWTQMVLRAPTRTKLAKTGSFEKWMIEMEVGLRHRNPWASGILYTKSSTVVLP